VTTKTDTTESESLLPDVRRMADEIRVRIHLAGLEAKDAWAKLEPKLHELEHKAERATDHAKEQLVEFGTMIKRELQELTSRLTREDKSNTTGGSANDPS
jgi:hypothetical protein